MRLLRYVCYGWLLRVDLLITRCAPRALRLFVVGVVAVDLRLRVVCCYVEDFVTLRWIYARFPVTRVTRTVARRSRGLRLQVAHVARAGYPAPTHGYTHGRYAVAPTLCWFSTVTHLLRVARLVGCCVCCLILRWILQLLRLPRLVAQLRYAHLHIYALRLVAFFIHTRVVTDYAFR